MREVGQNLDVDIFCIDPYQDGQQIVDGQGLLHSEREGADGRLRCRVRVGTARLRKVGERHCGSAHGHHQIFAWILGCLHWKVSCAGGHETPRPGCNDKERVGLTVGSR